MNTQSNGYTVVYSAIMVVVVAAVLTLVSQGLKDRQIANEENANRASILRSAGIEPGEDVSADFKKYVTDGFVVDKDGNKSGNLDEAFKVASELASKTGKFEAADKYPVLVFSKDNETKYIVPIDGAGLWDRIWGFVSFKNDFNTIDGVVFNHAGETPGLGAEMTNPNWTKQFAGKQMVEGGQFKGVKIYKGNASSDPLHGIDAISGSTMTSNGVEAMVNDCVQKYSGFKQKLGQSSEAAPVAQADCCNNANN
jgi:Na+-transporting NADH:ubiquinone oxidoreductase subunit C